MEYGILITFGLMNMLAFALGAVVAALAGALLVQAFSWLPQVGNIPAMRSFVTVVLGGLGSLPGAPSSAASWSASSRRQGRGASPIHNRRRPTSPPTE